MDVRVDAAGSNDLSLTRDHFGSWSNNDVNVWLYIWVTGFPDGCYQTISDSDICLHNAPVVQNKGVGNDRINGPLLAGTLRLAHAITNYLPTSELHLFAVDGKILLYLDHEIRVRQAQSVANGWTKHLRVGCTTHSVWHSVLPHWFEARGNGPITALLKP